MTKGASAREVIERAIIACIENDGGFDFPEFYRIISAGGVAFAPIEPSEKMIEAAERVYKGDHNYDSTKEIAEEIYRAMLTAAQGEG